MKVTFSFFHLQRKKKKRKEEDTLDLLAVMHNSLGSVGKWPYLSTSAFKRGPEYVTSKNVSASRTHVHDKWLSRASKDPLGKLPLTLKD